MLYMVAAMHCEAKPFIREYELKRDDSARFFEVYRNDDKMLVISGIGKMRSAIATAHLLSLREPEDNAAVINIGTCGSISKSLPIGVPVLMNKIRDGETGKDYYPDILVPNMDLRQGCLETHNRVMTRTDMGQTDDYIEFVDMEASGFFQASERFVGPHQIYVIKVISDFLEEVLPDREYMADCMERAFPKIKAVIDNIDYFCRQVVQKEIFTSEDRKILEGLTEHLRLTNYQCHQLYDMARAFKIRTGSNVPEFKAIMEADVKTKEQGKMLFKQVGEILTEVRE